MSSLKALPEFNKANILIVGDIMLDRYWAGSTGRISPEAPVPVVHVQQTEDRLGGAANVAKNCQTLGCNTTLIGLKGDDEAGAALSHVLNTTGIHTDFVSCPDFQTITKLRVLSQDQQLIRCDFEGAPRPEHHEEIKARYATHLKTAQACVLSDYGKGTLGHPKAFIQLAKNKNIPILIDPKGKDFSRYEGATLLTPNLREFELVVGKTENDDHIVEKGLRALELHNLTALLVTRGKHGATLIQKDAAALHIPTRALEVYDVTGAGDTVIATLAASLACGVSLPEATHLANMAAGIAVSKLGTASVTVSELRRATRPEAPLDFNSGILTETLALEMLEDAKAHGEKIVMTNGCFDILHVGHLTYLEQARKLGDRLIIAVNTDDSVSRLKGPHRPIHPLNHRLSMLAGLACVDWVVPFSEDTPQRLIELLKPDILVKGADYQVHEIAGAQSVLDNGGQVELLPFVDGLSTSNTIQTILEKETKRDTVV